MAQISRSDFAVGQNLHRSYPDGLSSTVKVFVSNTPRLQKGRLTPNPTVLQPLSAKMSVKVLAASVSKFPSRKCAGISAAAGCWGQNHGNVRVLLASFAAAYVPSDREVNLELSGHILLAPLDRNVS